MTSVGPNLGVSNITQIDISSMDLETALMTVQQQRTRLLDTQLQSQIQEVQGRNENIAKLNNALSELNKMQAFYGTDANKTFSEDGASRAFNDSTGKPQTYEQFTVNYQASLNRALQDAGVTDVDFPIESKTFNLNDEGQRISQPGGAASWGGNVTKGQMETAITKIKGLIDAQSNNQQMDMLRLQSMSNKRNEAFDTMTNFIKKMQDSRSSIIGNMR